MIQLKKLYKKNEDSVIHKSHHYWKGIKKTQQVPRIYKSVHEIAISRLRILRSILFYVDRISMASSVETRVPFLDYRLVEFCLSLPINLKINDGLQKYILRKAMKDIIPKKIYNRTDKMGFSSPESVWAKNDLKEFFSNHIEDIRNIPFLNYSFIKNRFDQFIKGREPYDNIFWRLISFKRWLEIYNISI